MSKKLTKTQQKQLQELAKLPDHKINTTDIPELKSLAGAVRGMFYRPVTKPVTIRLNAPDIEMARQISQAKGMPYQTYIKELLHKALKREIARV